MLSGLGQARYSKLAFKHTIEGAAVQLRESRIAMLAMSFRAVLIGGVVSAVVPLVDAQLITHRDLPAEPSTRWQPRELELINSKLLIYR